MKIYIWSQQGRLGNLIFQYQAIKNMTEKKDVIFSLDNEVFKVLQVEGKSLRVPISFFAKYDVLSKLLIYFWDLFFTLLSKLRILSKVEAEEVLINNYPSETKKLKYTLGLFYFIIVVRGFFQSDDNFLHPISLQNGIKKTAEKKLRTFTGSRTRIGVHIRTTDYEKWSIMGKQGLVLPRDWYLKAMQSIKARIPDGRYVIFTDDISAARLFFEDEEYSIYRGDSDFEDLVGMALCDHLIISPSSFSLAAALASYEPGKIIIAPKYWLGFKSQEWFPADIYSNKLEYLNVDLH